MIKEMSGFSRIRSTNDAGKNVIKGLFLNFNHNVLREFDLAIKRGKIYWTRESIADGRILMGINFKTAASEERVLKTIPCHLEGFEEFAVQALIERYPGLSIKETNIKAIDGQPFYVVLSIKLAQVELNNLNLKTK